MPKDASTTAITVPFSNVRMKLFPKSSDKRRQVYGTEIDLLEQARAASGKSIEAIIHDAAISAARTYVAKPSSALLALQHARDRMIADGEVPEQITPTRLRKRAVPEVTSYDSAFLFILNDEILRGAGLPRDKAGNIVAPARLQNSHDVQLALRSLSNGHRRSLKSL